MKVLWRVESRLLHDLVDYDKNPRKITKKNLAQLAESIDKFGLADIVIINLDNTIISGHQRAAVLMEQYGGGYEVDVRVPDRILSEEEVRELVIKLNRHVGEWDNDLLGQFFEIHELREWGFAESEIKPIPFVCEEVIGKTDPDEVPEVDEESEPVTRRGDIYVFGGGHRLMCGDSVSSVDVDLLMGTDKADMVFTDPPYLMDFQGALDGEGNKSKNGRKIRNDKLSKSDGEKFLRDICNIIRTYNQGAFYITFYRLGIQWLLDAIRDSGLKWRNIIIWHKKALNLSNSDYKATYEPMILGWADDYTPVFYGWTFDHNWYGKKNEKDLWELFMPSVWEIPRTRVNDLHPTMKPVDLVMRAIYNSSKKGDIVLDLFGGSGTTLISCVKARRFCRMMEMGEHFCDVIIERYRQFTGDDDITVIRDGEEVSLCSILHG